VGKSFRNAFRGIAALLASQRNARIHALATVAACAAGAWLGIGRHEWCWIVLAIAAVWTAEALNTALELLADAVHPESHPLVGKAKDAAAAAVLIAAIGAAVIGLLVFGPYLLAAVLESRP
jgi:diacylglycerol kinase (ATP)